jgi:large subunit ribosomal protein L13
MKTFFQTKEAALAARKWVVVDAAARPVGRVASEVALLLRGKHKPQFTMNQDGGDFVVVVNASKAVFTGRKLSQKKYYWHSGYVGGIKEVRASDLMQRRPEEVIRRAVVGMLPNGPLGNRLEKKLRIFSGEDHHHTAQNPEIRSTYK